jgi:hypothetical protein
MAPGQMERHNLLLRGRARRNPRDASTQAAPVADAPAKGEYRSGHGDSATQIRATPIGALTPLRAGRQPGPTFWRAKARHGCR